MDIFHDIDGGRIITSSDDKEATQGLTEALVLELAALIGDRVFDNWIDEYEVRGGLEGLQAEIRLREIATDSDTYTLSSEESVAACHGLARLAFDDTYERSLPKELEDVKYRAASLLKDLAALALRPPN